jgi:glucoamylase
MAGRLAALTLVLPVSAVPAAGAAGTAPGARGSVADAPEQVWDDTGEGTLSATPLAWTQAQFVRLAWSIDAARPVEQPSIVACRCAKECR